MRNVKIKTTCSSTNAVTTLAHPNAELGNFRDAALQIREITNVPDNTYNAAVLSLWNQTTDITWIGGNHRFAFDYSELGKIIRK